MKQKDILFIGINFYPEPTGIGKYSGEMVEWLSEKGLKIEVITGFPYYPNWKLEKIRYWYEVAFLFHKKVKVTRCPLYVPKKPTGIKRMLQEITFSLSALPKIIAISIVHKPKFIICIAPPFHLGLLGYISKIISGGKLIYHIQDLQIEAATALNMIKYKWLIKIMFKIEKIIFNKSNHISTIHPNMVLELRKKNISNILLLPNWIDIHLMYPIKNSITLREEYKLPTDKKIFLYSGSLGEKQGIEIILNIAEEFNNNENFLFIIAGNGPFHEEIKKMIIKREIKNLITRNLVAASELNQWLNIADFHLIIQKNETSNFLFPSKLISILSVGGTCIALVPESNKLGNMLVENQIGQVISETSSVLIKEQLINIASNDYQKIKTNARKYAEVNFCKERVLTKWSKDILLMKS